MANWNNPGLASLYTDFLTELKARDVDVLTLNPGTNLPVGAKRWNTPTSTFQVWDGAVWNNLVIGSAGGGTGATVPLPPLGTMATQNSNAVAITGGTITGVALDAGSITTGILALNRGGTGASLALGGAGSFLQVVGGAVAFGVNGAALQALNASQVTSGKLAMAVMPVSGTWNLTGPLELVSTSYVRLQGSGFIVGGIADMGAGTINAQAIYINGVPIGGGSSIPAGMMALFSGGCPAGWTWVVASEDRFLRVTNGGNGFQGGTNLHSHGVNGNTGSVAPNTSFTNAYNGTNRSFDAGGSFSGFLPNNASTHQHSVDLHGHPVNIQSDDIDWKPLYIDYTLCRKD